MRRWPAPRHRHGGALLLPIAAAVAPADDGVLLAAPAYAGAAAAAGARAARRGRARPAAALPDGAKVDEQEWKGFGALNELRAQGYTCGSQQTGTETHYPPNNHPLVFDCRLWRACKLHAQDLADNNYFSHYSQDGRSPWDRVAEQGTEAGGENIAAGSPTVDSALAQWKNSAPHCSNMMNSNYVRFGMGWGYNTNAQYRNYWCELLSATTDDADTSCYPDTSAPTGYPTLRLTSSPTTHPPSSSPIKSPTPEPLPCLSWCYASQASWAMKCAWPQCGGCAANCAIHKQLFNTAAGMTAHKQLFNTAAEMTADTTATVRTISDPTAKRKHSARKRGTCAKWCGNAVADWTQKCTWVECSRCAACAPETCPVLKCQHWCKNHARALCEQDQCNGCTDCIEKLPAWVKEYSCPVSNCVSWCAAKKVEAPWATRCSWDDCNGCSECSTDNSAESLGQADRADPGERSAGALDARLRLRGEK